MESFAITGLRPRPDAVYKAQRAQAERDRLWAVDTRADTTASQQCPVCGQDEYDTEASPPYCPRCGYQGLTRNGAALDQRAAHACAGCQAPTTSERLCGWCRKWAAIEARAMRRHGVVSEREISRFGTSW